MAMRQSYDALLQNLNRVPAHLLKDLRKAVRKELNTRYPDHHKRKYGPTLNRTFTPEEYARFMSCARNNKARLAFQLMHDLGLRIGEVVDIKITDIDWLNRTLLVRTEKSHTCDVLPLHEAIFPLVREWVNQHHTAILNHDGYLFYSENPVQHRQHISKDWLRNYFAEVREDAGLTQIYAFTNEHGGRTPRRQYRITTHSNRRTFGTHLWHLTKDVKLVQLSLRQTSAQSTEPYIYVGQEEVHSIIRTAYQMMQLTKEEKHLKS